MDLGIPELVVILVIVVVLFGPGRLGRTMGELGSGIRSFKEGLQDKDEKDVKEIDDRPDLPAGHQLK